MIDFSFNSSGTIFVIPKTILIIIEVFRQEFIENSFKQVLSQWSNISKSNDYRSQIKKNVFKDNRMIRILLNYPLQPKIILKFRCVFVK